MEQSDRGYVGQRLADASCVVVQRRGGGVEQAQHADDLRAQPHGQGVDRGEADLASSSGELVPASGGGQVGDGNGLASVEAGHAGALVGLQLETFQRPGGFGGGDRHLQNVASVGE
jgi:hypothetical protein